MSDFAAAAGSSETGSHGRQKRRGAQREMTVAERQVQREMDRWAAEERKEREQMRRTWKHLREHKARLEELDAEIDVEAFPSRVSAQDLCVRTMTDEELGLLYNWLKADEENGGEKWWFKF